MVRALVLVAALIAVNLLLGIVTAIREHRFDWLVLPEFLRTAIVPVLGGLVVLAIGGTIILSCRPCTLRRRPRPGRST